MKAVLLIDTLACGGRERQFAGLVQALVEQKLATPDEISVILMAEDGHFNSMIENAGVRVVRLCRRWRWDPGIVFRLSRLFHSLRPSVVCSFSEMTTCYAALAGKPSGTKLIDASLRNALPLKSLKFKILGWINYRAADLVVANSRAGLAAKGAPPAKARLLYNGFNLQRAETRRSPQQVRALYGIQTPWVVGMVATFSRFKDWDTFFAAADRVRSTRQDVTFMAVGDGEFSEAYKQKYADQPGIVFTGRVKDVESLVGAFNLGLLCSNPQSAQEGIPNVVMEYMALRVPAVVTRGGGVAELVLDGQTGFIVEPKQPAALADRIRWFMDNPELAKAMGESGRKRIEQEFSMERAARTFMAMVQELTKNGR